MWRDTTAYSIGADSDVWHMMFWDWHQGPTFHGLLLWLLVSLVAALPLLLAALLVGKRRGHRKNDTGSHLRE